MTEHSTSTMSVVSTRDWQPNPASWVNGSSWSHTDQEWETDQAADADSSDFAVHDLDLDLDYVVEEQDGGWIAKQAKPALPYWFQRSTKRMAERDNERAKETHPRIDYEHPDEWDLLEI